MIIRRIKYKNGRTIYKRTGLMDKIKYYEDTIYSIVFVIGIITVLVFIITGLIRF